MLPKLPQPSIHAPQTSADEILQAIRGLFFRRLEQFRPALPVFEIVAFPPSFAEFAGRNRIGEALRPSSQALRPLWLQRSLPGTENSGELLGP